ncbi:phage/plasmid primase, P4 family [uncultured Methanomethylovorans sp.]|uniref:phage/plasmid primase, P4 family n=1 Tax=uncultured Methanomethylovorans sp. TaxID=183759 RepID=UPI00260526AF|nr:phage/plasmid primase, P4 family [uncultured Methanomethylovorans sp.]
MNEITVSDIKNKLDIVQVIERYGYALKKEGSEYKGAISATSRSGKSLNVNPDKQVYNDFAGHAGSGDVLDFIAFVEDLDIKNDFLQVIQIAADQAGIVLDNIDYSQAADGRELHRLNGLVFGYYHSLLTDEIRELIRSKWGITDQTINDLQIGWAPENCHLLQVPEIKDYFGTEILKRSGLFYCNDNDNLVDIYRGRIVFPYWQRGGIVYSIGRDPKWDENKNKKKFIKQLVRSEKYPYVSPAVENVLFGLDSIKGKDTIYITEGIADSIALLQADRPVLSPVTVQFKDSDVNNVVMACKGKKLVKIINDNEDNESGLNGAIKTAKAYETAGIRAEIIILPRPEGEDKIDVAEYLKEHSIQELDSIHGSRVWDIILDKHAPAEDVPEDIVDKLELAEVIIKELSFMPEHYRKPYVMNTVRERLNIDSKNDLKNRYKTVVDEQPREAPGIEVTFLRGNGQLRTKKLSQAIMGLNHYITMKDNKDVYYYKEGVYVRGGEDIIKKGVQDILGDYSSEQRQKEIVNYIRNSTLVERDEIGHDCTRINLLNGIYNLESGELEPHRPEYISIHQIPINYDPEATCDKIDKYMSEVLKPDDIQTILEYFGYCLIPDTRMQKSLLVHGPGQGGKSVLLTVLGCAIGAINCSRESLHKLENDKYSVAELYGKLVNIFPDLASATIYENEMFKQISGNEHKLRGERKFGHPFQFKNTARLVFSANDLPPVPKGDFAYFRRWILIKMDTLIDESKQDKNLTDKLTTPEELSGLLNKMIAALKILLQNGKFSYNKTVPQVEEEYLIHSDPIAAFAKARLTYSDDYVLKRDVLTDYVEWCREHNKIAVYEGQLSKKLIKLGYRPGRLPESQGHLGIWHGCALKSRNKKEDKTDTVQNSDDYSTGFKKQPCIQKPISIELQYRGTGLNTPLGARENKKNISSSSVDKKNKINTCTIETSNPVTLSEKPVDSVNGVQGYTSEPCTDPTHIENWFDQWESSNGPIYGKRAIKATMDITKAKSLHSSEYAYLEAAVKKLIQSRCVECGSSIIYGESLDTGEKRCKGCYDRYFSRPAAAIPEELVL